MIWRFKTLVFGVMKTCDFIVVLYHGYTQMQIKVTLPETNIVPKWMIERLISFWEGLCSGAMLASGSVLQ